jgi:hypothetical protein
MLNFDDLETRKRGRFEEVALSRFCPASEAVQWQWHRMRATRSYRILGEINKLIVE